MGRVHFRHHALTFNFLPPESLPAVTEWEEPEATPLAHEAGYRRWTQ